MATKVAKKEGIKRKAGAPLGNKYAVGNQGGAPQQYTEEFIKGEALALLEWIKEKRNIYLNGFACDRGYSPQRLTEFAKVSYEFSEALKHAKDHQVIKFMGFTLDKDMDINAIKYWLPRMCQDKPWLKVSWDQAADENVERPQNIIINEIKS